MRALLIGLLIQITTTLHAQRNTFDPNRKYHPDSLRKWTTSIMMAISKKHPGFYRYTSKGKFDYLIDSTKQTITDSLTELGYYRKLKPLVAQIGCLHTEIHLSDKYQDYLNKTSTFIPLATFIDSEKKAFISKRYDLKQDIPIGGEIISINGEPMSDILKKLFNAIPSDGYNETEKILVLNHHFALWYQTIIDVTDNFTVEILTEDSLITASMKGVGIGAFPTWDLLESANKKQLKFDASDSVGILTVHSFAKSVIKKNRQNFKKFIKEVFNRIEKDRIENLVIDLRYNTGGTDGNAVFLASYFFDKPFKYWDKIEVTEAVANEIKGLYRLFYKKPKKAEGSYRWRKMWLTNEFDYYETQNPAKNNFKGNTYIITNGLCLSSCADFVAVLSHNKKAIVVGQETGGGFQGNTSGLMPTATMPTGLQITVPLQKYTTAVDVTKNFGHGTKPDHEVSPRFDDWINKKDVEMQHTLNLLKENY